MIDPLLAAKQRSHFHFKTSDRTADWRKLNEYSDVGNECLDVIYECPDVNKECQDVCHKCLDVIYRMS
ncbi:hypothetical protein [Fischerella sp. PCC 9605]|uniref:hypothetical protein n=1 Tax=Fischerella sp. PCC 9605 TaxID=1173024 RepID=UPI0004B36866|nr:hypothetical protein [Fischerella sp. PCC 9605]